VVVSGSETQLDVDRVIDLSGPMPAEHRGPADVQARIFVGGDLSGQVAVGSNIMQVRVDTVHGDLITVAPGSSAPIIERRAPPVRLLPRRPATFLDRETETARILGSVFAAEAIGISGPTGVGKSAVLRHVAHEPQVVSAAGGVVHLSCAGDSVGDVARSLFDAIYETSIPYQPSGGELRQRFADVQVALLLDDVELSSDEADRVLDLLPRSGVVMASERPLLSSSVPLGSLPADEAASLVQGMGLGEHATAARIAEVPDATPQQLLRAGARSAEADLDDDERRALWLLAAVPGLRLDARQLSELGAGDGSPRVVEQLAGRGLLRWHAGRNGAAGRYSAVSDLAEVVQVGEVEAARHRIHDHFDDWARRHRHTLSAAPSDVDAAREVLADAARRQRWDLTVTLALTLESTFAVMGRWGAWSATLDLLEGASTRMGDEGVRAFALHQRGVLEICSGHTAVGLASLQQALHIRERVGDHRGVDVTRSNLRLFAPPPPPPPPATTAPSSLPWLPLVIGTLFAVGAIIAGLYAADAWPFRPAEASSVLVLNVIGLSSEDAVQRLSEAGLVAAVSEDERTDAQPGIVVEQDPPAGTEVTDDRTVRLTVARAPNEAPVTVPDVVGLDIDDARAAIEDADLDPLVELRDTPTVQPGIVTEQSPPAGTEVTDDRTVRLTVARAPNEAPVTVPDVVGLDIDDARAAIEDADLDPLVELRDTPTVQPGIVTEQNPSADASVERGSSVTLVVADEPAVVMPALVGRSSDEADAMLERVALTSVISDAGPIEPPAEGLIPGFLDAGTVIRQTPPAGTPLAFGDTVELVVVPVPSVTVPNVVELNRSDAEERLAEAELTPATTTIPAPELTCNTVEVQNPLADYIVPQGTDVDLTVTRCLD
jgi:beta-lactam-binding protein with PASTA domain